LVSTPRAKEPDARPLFPDASPGKPEAQIRREQGGPRRRFSPGAASSSHCSGALRDIVVEKFLIVDAEGRMQP